jgi:hypothetical protein
LQRSPGQASPAHHAVLLHQLLLLPIKLLRQGCSGGDGWPRAAPQLRLRAQAGCQVIMRVGINLQKGNAFEWEGRAGSGSERA